MAETTCVVVEARPSGGVFPTPAGAPAGPGAVASHAAPGALGSVRGAAGAAPLPEMRPRRGLSSKRSSRALAYLVAAYFLGGTAPLFLRLGRRRVLWATVGILTFATWVAIAWRWSMLCGLAASGRLPLGPCLAGLVMLAFIETGARGRALVLAGRDRRFRPERLPSWQRHPWVVAGLGLPLPGFGLLVAARPLRACLALANALGTLLGVLFLANAPMFWRWNALPGGGGLPGAALETGFIACMGLVALGGLLWIASALDGARLLGPGRDSRRARGDWIALALVASTVAFAATFRPASMARDADRAASTMRRDGYRLIPLCLDLTAARLDPGRPEYAMHAAQLYVERGERDAARAIYERLHERWEGFAQMLLREEASSRMPLQSQLITPGPDLAPQRGAPPLERE